MMPVSDKFFALTEGLIGYISHWVYKKIWNIWSVRTDRFYFIYKKSLRLLLMEHHLDDVLEEFKSKLLNLIVILSIIFDLSLDDRWGNLLDVLEKLLQSIDILIFLWYSWEKIWIDKIY